MARKMGLAGLATSLEIANATYSLMGVLEERHPNDPDLKLARRMFLEFNVKLGDKHTVAEAEVVSASEQSHMDKQDAEESAR